MHESVLLVGDGWTDLYGVFSTRELAQGWIDRQHKRQVEEQKLKGQNECKTRYEIETVTLDEAKDLIQ